jgi:hypothetical protein
LVWLPLAERGLLLSSASFDHFGGYASFDLALIAPDAQNRWLAQNLSDDEFPQTNMAVSEVTLEAVTRIDVTTIDTICPRSLC